MQDALNLFEFLTDDDQDWILQTGVERQLIANSEFIREGEQPEAIFIVLDGLVGVTTRAFGAQPLARLGAGQILAEMSFLDGSPATASVAAAENSLVLELPIVELQQRIDTNAEFAARFYRALAVVQNRRLRRAVRDMGKLWSDGATTRLESDEQWNRLSAHIEGFKTLVAEADKAAIKSEGVVPDEFETRILDGFDSFAGLLHETLSDRSGLSEQVRNDLGYRVQREVLPFIQASELCDRMYAKPRGYAGDYLTIAIMYRGTPEGTGRIGPVIDRASRRQPACRAVVNRRALLADEIGKTLAATTGGTAHVTSLASGPAAELFDAFGQIDDPNKLAATCIDIDALALDYVGERCDEADLRSHFDLHGGNLVYLASGRQTLDLAPQDLMYSIGLIDYFSDKFVIRLLDWVYDCLRPGGRVILGNFHVDNQSKQLMDYVFEWNLIHRSEDDMHRLYESSKFGTGCTNIRYEEAGVNLFAECVKR